MGCNVVWIALQLLLLINLDPIETSIEFHEKAPIGAFFIEVN
jgi:hypothetical protein